MYGLNAVALPVYDLAAAVFVLLTIHGFFCQNQKQYQKFSVLWRHTPPMISGGTA